MDQETAPIDAPQVETPVDAPAVEAPVETPAPDVDSSPLEQEATLLGSEPEGDSPDADAVPETPAEPKPDDESGEVDAGTDEASQSDEPASLPTYEAFTLPEGFSADDEMFGQFTKELGELQNLTKADQAKMQEFGQKMIDQHVTAINDTVSRLNDYYTNAWEKQKNDWKDSFETDPDIGGNRRDTTLKSAKEAIKAYGGTADQQQALRQLFDQTGIGNHPQIIRFMANVGANLAEGKPVPASIPAKAPQSKLAKRYGSTE